MSERLIIDTPSGARLTFEPSTVIKTAPDKSHVPRLLSQAKFMRSIGPEVFPRVHQITPRGYIMERLHRWHDNGQVSSLSDDMLVDTARNILSLLQLHVWVVPAKLHRRWAEKLMTYLERVITAVIESGAAPLSLTDPVRRAVRDMTRLSMAAIEPVQVHGDPTIENSGWRTIIDPDGDGHDLRQLVLLDPLPCTTTQLPPMIAVDVGKVLQSVLGYEDMRDPLRPGVTEALRTVATWARHPSSVTERELQPQLAHDALVFLAVHLLRAMPYQRLGSARGDWLLNALAAVVRVHWPALGVSYAD